MCSPARTCRSLTRPSSGRQPAIRCLHWSASSRSLAPITGWCGSMSAFPERIQRTEDSWASIYTGQTHVRRDRLGGQELGSGGDGDRVREILKRHLDDRSSLNILHPDGVERDVDGPSLLGHFGDVLLDGLLV